MVISMKIKHILIHKNKPFRKAAIEHHQSKPAKIEFPQRHQQPNNRTSAFNTHANKNETRHIFIRIFFFKFPLQPAKLRAAPNKGTANFSPAPTLGGAVPGNEAPLPRGPQSIVILSER